MSRPHCDTCNGRPEDAFSHSHTAASIRDSEGVETPGGDLQRLGYGTRFINNMLHKPPGPGDHQLSRSVLILCSIASEREIKTKSGFKSGQKRRHARFAAAVVFRPCERTHVNKAVGRAISSASPNSSAVPGSGDVTLPRWHGTDMHPARGNQAQNPHFAEPLHIRVM